MFYIEYLNEYSTENSRIINCHEIHYLFFIIFSLLAIKFSNIAVELKSFIVIVSYYMTLRILSVT